MVTNIISDNIIAHSKKVAELMYNMSKKNKEEMYLLGLLHDIGKIYGNNNHEITGAKLAQIVGFMYYNEICYHGRVQKEYFSKELDLLNAADLCVDSHGNAVGFKNRVEDIGIRYGHNSSEYLTAVKLGSLLVQEILEAEKIIYEGSNS